jgi:hypothetical protein
MKRVYDEEDRERFGLDKYSQEYIEYLELKANIDRHKYYCARRNTKVKKVIKPSKPKTKDSEKYFYYLKIAAAKIKLNFSFEIFKTQLSHEITRITEGKMSLADYTDKQLLFLYDLSLNSSGDSFGR